MADSYCRRNTWVTNWSPRRLLQAGICYVPQGRNIFPEMSVRHNIEFGAVAAGPEIQDMPARIKAALEPLNRFECYLLNTCEQSSAYLERLGEDGFDDLA